MQITLGQQYNVGEKPTVIFTAYQNKKGNKKVVFTGRLQGGACSLYSIGESVQCIHSLLYVLDNVTNNAKDCGI